MDILTVIAKLPRTGVGKLVLANDLDVYPYLPKANVGKTCAASYLCLMPGCVR